MQAVRRLAGLGSLLIVVALAPACGDAPDGVEEEQQQGGRQKPQPDPVPGETLFYSADGRQGTPSPGGEDDGAAAPEDGGLDTDGGAGGSGGERTVEEGDVYRAFGTGRLLNLNAYRGLQVIDVANLSAPSIVGRLEMSGTPVELYVSGNTAYVLMNDWRSYWGARGDVQVDTWNGGVVLSVDLSDPANPVVIDRELVPGWIYKSRLVKGGGQEALYVVSQEYGYVTAGGSSSWTTTTKVKSFGIASGQLTAASELDLGGWISDIAATPEALLVARHDWQDNSGRSLVSIIDISDPAGTMIEGDEIRVEGLVRNQFNMDLRGNVLRVVSGRTWNGGANANHLEIFDATDLHNLVRIDHDTFGENEDLFATLFLDNAGLFVTYFRTDPFHAFAITDAGQATEKSEFVVSGWNDFFRPVFGDRRLVGIGMNDETGRAVAVSLYDITDLTNPDPLVARAEVVADNSWSEANWDHRAFSVIEDAVAVQAGGGVVETGLVLLPFTGWDSRTQTWTAGVQIYTFSETTLTRRGVMNHGSPVHRTFQPAEEAAANLSQEELSLFDLIDPDRPRELSRLDLAPNYTDVIPFGAYAVRRKERDDWYRTYYGGQARPAVAQVIPRDVHPDSAQPVASFEVPRGATLRKVGNLLAVVTQDPIDTSSWPYTWETTIQVHDLSDPAHPVARGSLTTTAIDRLGYGGPYWADYDCFDCGWGWYGGSLPVHAVGNALAFVEQHPEEQALGQEQVCQSSPRDYGTCYGGGWADGCTIVDGWQVCRTRDGNTTCTGQFVECVFDADEESFACEPYAPAQGQLRTDCYTYEAKRYWTRFEVEVVDLSQPDAPALAPTVTTPRSDEAVSVLVDGTDLWLSYQQPYAIAGDPRPYVRHFSRRLDLSNPSQPALGSGINLPGQLLAIEGDLLFTRDQVWGAAQIEAAVARLRLAGGAAVLEAHRRFADQYVEAIALDGAGHVLVSHRAFSTWYGYRWADGATDAGQKLTILDAAAAQLDPLATVAVDGWATLKDARAGRALFQVPGGLLVFNLETPTAPWPQAFFATKGWPSEIVVDGRKILFAAGRYGIYEFDLDRSNLTVP